MDFRKLQYFLAVAEEGQITKAAKRLHMAQPPLSQQLKLLETELGIQLIERSNRRNIKLTDAGQLLRNRAEQILALVDQTVRELKNATKSFPKKLLVAITPTWDNPFLPDRICKFRGLYPEIDCQPYRGDSDSIEELLQSGAVEIAVAGLPSDLETYAAILLSDEPFVAVFAPDQENFVPAHYVHLTELADKPLIIHRKHEAVLEYYKEIGLEPSIRCQHSDIRSMLAWANTGLGVAIVPKSAVNLIPDHTLIIKEIIEPPIKTTPIALVWIRNHTLSAAARHFIDMFSKTI
jgi:DNA-binding transcriptional LysR family regulator